jgi:phage terminase large subunit GpA-like protein
VNERELEAAHADPLMVTCPHCGSEPGIRCGTVSDWARKPHKARVKLALVLAAHADPALDGWFAKQGACGICGVPGLPQRHRVVDAIAGALAAGEDREDVAGEYGVTAAAIQAVASWAERWPGAWQ